MKLIIKLSGLAISIASIIAAKILIIYTKDDILYLMNLPPIQFKIEKNQSQISTNFHPKFDGEYSLLFVPLSLVGTGKKAHGVVPPSVKIKISREDRNIPV